MLGVGDSTTIFIPCTSTRYVNGDKINLNTPRLLIGNVSQGDGIQCSCKVFDGDDYSEVAFSDLIVMGNLLHSLPTT